LLGEEPRLTPRDLESASTRHRVDDLRERLEDGAAHQLDRAHEADAARQGDDREAPSAHAPPEKSPGHPEAECRHVASPIDRPGRPWRGEDALREPAGELLSTGVRDQCEKET